jgi:hypothetical protein
MVLGVRTELRLTSQSANIPERCAVLHNAGFDLQQVMVGRYVSA